MVNFGLDAPIKPVAFALGQFSNYRYSARCSYRAKKQNLTETKHQGVQRFPKGKRRV